jgi:hypothetical protein
VYVCNNDAKCDWLLVFAAFAHEYTSTLYFLTVPTAGRASSGPRPKARYSAIMPIICRMTRLAQRQDLIGWTHGDAVLIAIC